MQKPDIIYSVYEGEHEPYCLGHAKTREVAEAILAYRKDEQEREFIESLKGLTEEEIKEEKEDREDMSGANRLFIAEENLFTSPEHILITHYYIDLNTLEMHTRKFLRSDWDKQITVYDNIRPIADGERSCLHVSDYDKNSALKRAVAWLEEQLASGTYHEKAVIPDMDKIKKWVAEETK